MPLLLSIRVGQKEFNMWTLLGDEQEPEEDEEEEQEEDDQEQEEDEEEEQDLQEEVHYEELGEAVTLREVVYSMQLIERVQQVLGNSQP